MKLVLSFLVLFVSGVLHSQILDTLRIDSCLNSAFNKTQVDYYYLEQDNKDIKLVRITKILGVPFPTITHNDFIGSEIFLKTDKTGKKKEDEKDTLTIENPDGSINYLLVSSYNSYKPLKELLVSEKYIVPSGNHWFFDHLPNGKAFREVILDSAGKMVAEMSNNQVDSFGNSFIQMDKDSNVVVYQKQGWVLDTITGLLVKDHSKAQTYCYYANGNLAYTESKANDTIWRKKIFWRNGKLKQNLLIAYITTVDETISEPESPVWKTLKIVTAVNYDEEGVLLEE